MSTLLVRLSRFFPGRLASACVPIAFALLLTLSGVAHSTITTIVVDATGNVGQYTSMQLSASGAPVISYYDVSNGDLKLALCDDAACAAPAYVTVDSAGDVGLHSSLRLTAGGIPLISYFDATNGDLKLAICGDAACTTATLVTLDTVDVVGQYTSLQLNAAGHAVVSYFDVTNADLKLATCTTPDCSSFATTIVDAVGAVGAYASLQLNASDFPVISYHDVGSGNLKIAYCSDVSCTAPAVRVAPATTGNVGQYTALQLNASGFAVVAHHDATNAVPRLVVCGNPDCTANTGTLLDGLGTTGDHLSMRLSGSIRPVVSYHHAGDADLKVLICTNSTCTGNFRLVVDAPGAVGEFTSVQLNADGFPVIAYYDATNGDLKLATLSAATVTSVAVPADANYVTGQNLDFIVNWSDPVDVSGAPQLPLTIGAASVNATYVSGSGTAALTFRYTVQAGDFDNDGIAVGAAIAPNGGTIRWVGFDSVLTLNGVPATAGILVNNAFTVTPSAGANGSITPATAQSVAVGSTTSFTVLADPGYTAVVGGSCGGTLVGTVYTTNAIVADCTVDATFTQITHTVTPSAGANGSITPNTPQPVAEGATTSFSVTATPGYSATVGGSCGGTLVGSTYTTNAILADCTVVATFTQITHTVTPSAGANGSITPNSAQSVAQGGTLSFTIAGDAGYAASVGGTCGGTLAGSTYTTNAILADCTVVATFTQITYTVTPSAGVNGSISPTTPQSVVHGNTIAFVVAADAGYSPIVTSSCGGALVGTTFTTDPITASCTVAATYQVITGGGNPPFAPTLVPALSSWSVMLLMLLMIGGLLLRRK